MTVYIVIFFLFLTMIALMSVGVLLRRPPISGSCGGLNNVGIKKVCDCEDSCNIK